MLEKTLESPLDCKDFKPVNPKGNQPWVFIRSTDTEAEAPILWPPDVKSWLIRKDPDAEKAWRQEEKGMTEEDMVGWHHRFNGHEFEQALGDDEGQESLVAVHGVAKSWAQLSNWTTTNKELIQPSSKKPQTILLKNGQRTWKTFLQRWHTDGQQVQEKMLNITSHLGNVNRNHNEISPWAT